MKGAEQKWWFEDLCHETLHVFGEAGPYLDVRSGTHQQTSSCTDSGSWVAGNPCPWCLPAPAAQLGAAAHGAVPWSRWSDRPIEAAWSPESEYAVVSSDVGNNLESMKRTKQRGKQGVWTCNPLELSSARAHCLGSAIPQTLPHPSSSDDNMP